MVHELTRWLHGHVLFPAVVAARGEASVFRHLRELESLQWRSGEEIRRRQDQRLREMLSYAADRLPFHRDRIGAAARADVTEVRRALKTIPVLTKSDLQAHAGQLVVAGLRRVTRKTTGGSTGQAVTLVKDREAIAREMAASALAYGWFGVRFGDRAARFWGAPATLQRKLRSAAADFATHRIRFSAFAFDENDLERYWRRCLEFRPDWFYGYVSMLDAFARFVARRGYDGASLRLKVIVTTAEVLTDPQRRVLAETFGTRVQNEYGCGEVGPIAYECDRGRLHLMTEGQVVEVVKPDGSDAGEGETGQIVVTDLNNRAMPLVRYQLGDLAVPGAACACGRGFPVLERVWGRAYDFVETADGRRYHGEFFMYMFEDLRSRGQGVAQFQVVQRAADALDVRFVAPPGGDESTARASIADVFRQRLPGMRVTVQRVAEIPRQASGKQLVISNEWARARSTAGAGQPTIGGPPA